jgi:3-hydroxymyristoyl/3-hydroxydecanoyl-(acyl carrier protein) dehydratase
MPKKVIFTIEDVMEILPHRPPFLFVDHVTDFKQNTCIATERYLHKEEPFFEGHFPGMPIMPGVLVTDALAQTSGLLWGFSRKNDSAHNENQSGTPPKEIFFLAAANIKYTNPAYPGDTLHMSSQAESHYGALYTYSVEAVVKRKVIAKGKLTLAMMKGSL